MAQVKGRFITFEGSEGCGKSTQARALVELLVSKGYDAKMLREPGGVIISEKIRAILLDKANTAMNKECETLLYMAARAQLVEEIVVPELEKGAILVCDRFLDSTIAYQGYGCGVDVEIIKIMGRFATKGVHPDLTFLLDLDTEEGLLRRGGERDRIELRSREYHDLVRSGYLEIAKKDPERVVVIDGRKSREENFAAISARVLQMLAGQGSS
jgi:dTMP kinase